MNTSAVWRSVAYMEKEQEQENEFLLTDGALVWFMREIKLRGIW